MIGDGDTATRSEVNEWQARQAEMERAMEQSVLESKSDDESVVTNIEN
jgi:hypothetical protein